MKGDKRKKNAIKSWGKFREKPSLKVKKIDLVRCNVSELFEALMALFSTLRCFELFSRVSLMFESFFCESSRKQEKLFRTLLKLIKK